MFFIVREPCSFSIKVNVTGKIKRLKNRPYGYNYYAKNVTIVFGRRDNVNSDGVIGISGNANRRTKMKLRRPLNKKLQKALTVTFIQ